MGTKRYLLAEVSKTVAVLMSLFTTWHVQKQDALQTCQQMLKSTIVSSSLTFDNWGVYYNGVLPRGQAAFSYSADGTYRSLSIQVTNVNVADGTVLWIEAAEQWITATGNAWSLAYYPVTINQNKGVFSVSTANGYDVPFLTPSAGQTNLYVCTPSRSPLMVVQLGHLL